jgi:NAD(P)-dependent dehydrogenase (short-subunit alcohol dehydrogenase family)
MTPMAEKFQANQAAMTRALQTIAMRKFASPEDIAKSVLFFASNEMSGHVTGQALFVSGGMEGRVLNSVEDLESGNAR